MIHIIACAICFSSLHRTTHRDVFKKVTPVKSEDGYGADRANQLICRVIYSKLGHYFALERANFTPEMGTVSFLFYGSRTHRVVDIPRNDHASSSMAGHRCIRYRIHLGSRRQSSMARTLIWSALIS